MIALYRDNLECLIEKSVIANKKYETNNILYSYYSNIYNYRYDFDTDMVSGDYLYTYQNSYKVKIKLDETKDNNINSFSCECDNYIKRKKLCTHVLELVKEHIKESKRYLNEVEEKERLITDLMSSYYNLITDDIIPVNKTKVILETSLSLSNSGFIEAKFKIGANKTYIVKNIPELISAYLNKSELIFGKNFTYNPLIHELDSNSENIIKLLKEIVLDDKLLDDMTGYKEKAEVTFIKNSKCTIPYKSIHEFLSYLGANIPITVPSKDGERTTVNFSVEHDISKLNIEVAVEDKNNGLNLSIKNKSFAFLNYNNEILLNENKIYLLDNDTKRGLLPLVSAILSNDNKELYIEEKYKSKFLTEVLPIANKHFNIKLADTLNQAIKEVSLVSKIFIDKYKESGICIKVSFIYDDITLNPFTNNTDIDTSLFVRDIVSEAKIKKIFELSNFIVKNGMLCLENEDEVYDFAVSYLPLLKDMSEIYYSKDFKFNLNYSPKIKSNIRLNNNLLELSFDFDEINKNELKDILKAIKIKKKYHKLKNGSFISLESSEFSSFNSLVNGLNISLSELDNEVIKLPKYRALYLDNILNDKNITHDFDSSVSKLINDVKNPISLNHEVPSNISVKLRDYQEVGFKWLKTLENYNLGGILADDMGLGKTLQVLALLLSNEEKSISIVIAPTSLVFNWVEEAKKFTPSLNVCAVSGNKVERDKMIENITDYDLIITSYATLRRDIDLYTKVKFKYCILDEAQHIKNYNTVNSKSVRLIDSEYKFALTGTPIENNLTELWSIFDFLMPGYLFSHKRFVDNFESKIVKDRDEDSLNNFSKHIKPFILRRLKKDVLKELPDKIEIKQVCVFEKAQQDVYNAYLAKAKQTLSKELSEIGFEKSQIQILSMLTRLRQICCDPRLFIENYEGKSEKLNVLLELLEELMVNNNKVLIFSQFTEMLNLIENELKLKNIDYFRLDGSVKAYDRMDMVKRFNNGEVSVFLISLKAGGTGLNLVGADTVIHFDPWWNPAVEDQATDRAYRMGQDKKVQVFKLITKNTIEEKIFEMQKRKKDLIESVIKPGETIINKLNVDEIKELFELNL